MRRLAALMVSAAALWAGQASAQAEPRAPIVSAAPEKVSVTIYRDPARGDGVIDRRAPSAFALITETRTIDLPPGEVTVRFEGVASGVVPQSAILFGADPRERNRDAALLSQRGLIDAFTGQRVILRRTDPATGASVEEPATIRSAADRLVVTTPRGVEAVYCTGLNQTLIFPHAPQTLSAKPVLSMLTRDQPGGKATVTLAYIATGFDWDATYVGVLSDDGRALELLGWLTMASGDETSFVDATAAAVAGRVNRSDETRDDGARQAIAAARHLSRSFGCWPQSTTSDLPYDDPNAPMPAPPPMAMAMESDNILVTARRRTENMMGAPQLVTAQAENLGDLKLYRIPVRVTVAAQSQKQVAFLTKPQVSGRIIYRARISDNTVGDTEKLFRFRNRRSDGLGQSLPAGKVVLYQDSRYGRLLIGESQTADKAVDEDVDLTFGDAGDVTVEDVVTSPPKSPGAHRHDLTISNANPFAVTFELEFPTGDDMRYSLPPGQITAKPGKRVWARTIPANAKVAVRFQATRSAD